VALPTITERIVSKKRHTTGFVVGKQEVTRPQAIKMARRQQIDGVRVANGPQGAYLVSTTDTSLYALPTRVAAGRASSARKSGAKKAASKTAAPKGGKKAPAKKK
jgi:hypothetical protein